MGGGGVVLVFLRWSKLRLFRVSYCCLTILGLSEAFVLHIVTFSFFVSWALFFPLKRAKQ